MRTMAAKSPLCPSESIETYHLFLSQVAPQGTVDQPELNNKRVPAKPLLMIEVSKEGPHEPAPAILSQRALPRLRPLRRGPHSDPYPEGAPLSLQTLWADFHRDQRHRLLPDAQAEVVGARGGYLTGLRLPRAGHRRRLRDR